MTKQEAFNEINKLQDEYVNNLLGLINSQDYSMMKTIDFTSATGTGKTKMMSKLINLLTDCYFIVTTLSKGQLHLQVREELAVDCKQDNYYVYGSADYKINSKLDAEDIIGKIPENTKCIWLRDEGHIKTNRYDEILMDVCYKVVNFSATNAHSDIQCNFTQTMMLRTVNQISGTPADAIKRLIEIKKVHKKVKGYNPCAIFRCVSGNAKLRKEIVALCKKNNLKYIDINDDPYVMAELCEDDNENDVIINKFKIVEGIDIRRAHILYMDNQPENNVTTIQAIGRCRRNALLYRDDIDILDPKNENLLKETRECYVYYNVKSMRIDTDQDGELQYAFCNHISCEALKPGTTVEVKNGQLSNGLFVLELEGQTGTYEIKTDDSTGFNIVEPITDFYRTKEIEYFNRDNYIYTYTWKVHVKNLHFFPMTLAEEVIDDPTVRWPKKKHQPYYDIEKASHCHFEFDWFCSKRGIRNVESVQLDIRGDEFACNLAAVRELFEETASRYTLEYIKANLNESNEGNEYINLPTIKLFVDYAYLFFIEKNNALKFNNELLVELASTRNCCNYIKKRAKEFDKLLRLLEVPKGMTDEYAESITLSINNLIECVNNRTIKDIHYDYEKYNQLVTEEERHLLNKNLIPLYFEGRYKNKYLTKKDVDEFIVLADYKRVLNDKHSALIGVDSMKQIRGENGSFWIEAKAITSKIGNYTKLDRYITKQYCFELECARLQCFSGKNSFSFDKKCNSIIGYCVEYYSKYLLYGADYLYPYIDKAKEEARCYILTKVIVIRACMLKYKAMMAVSFGQETARIIMTISAEQLMTGKYDDFINLVSELGQRTAAYVKANLYSDREPKNDTDPNLSVLHIAGLADYITPDTILDVKVRNNIDENCVRQVLAYHYLSTKRSDLNIKRVIVYDASSDRAVIVPIEPGDQKYSKGNKNNGRGKKGQAVL